MDALHQFVEKHGISEASLMLKGPFKKEVHCPSRDVCLKCTAVLKHFQFKTSALTKFGTKTAGKTEWGVSQKMQSMFKEAGLDYDSVKGLKNS